MFDHLAFEAMEIDTHSTYRSYTDMVHPLYVVVHSPKKTSQELCGSLINIQRIASSFPPPYFVKS